MKPKTPKLRFPAFGGEWEYKLFGSIYNFYNTNSFSRELLNYEIGDVKNIHYGDIHTKFKSNFDINNEKVPFINPDVDLSKVKEENYCKEKDLVMADASEDYKDIGKAIELINIGKQKLLAGLHTYIARDDNDKMALGFSGYLMQTHSVRLQMMKLATGISVLGISKGNLSKLELIVPQKQEQQKIADFLTAVDARIEALTKQQELMKQYKKGIMQKIFSQEMRFTADDGSEFPEWEEKELAGLVHFLRGSSLSKSDLVENGLNKCIHYGELFTTYQEKIFQIKSSTNLQEGQFSKAGDILMPSSDVTPQGLATASAIFEDGVIVGGDTNILRPKIDINSLFLSYFLNFNKDEIMKLVSGTTVKHIYNKDIAKLNIPFPTLSEQTKIANFLSSVDRKIEAVSAQLQAAKKFKKSLLQQMFV